MQRQNEKTSLCTTYSSVRTIGGNVHENGNLLRLLQLLIGDLILEAEPAWLVLLNSLLLLDLTNNLLCSSLFVLCWNSA